MTSNEPKFPTRPNMVNADPKRTHAPGSLSPCLAQKCVRRHTCAHFRATHVADEPEIEEPGYCSPCSHYVRLDSYAGLLKPHRIEISEPREGGRPSSMFGDKLFVKHRKPR